MLASERITDGAWSDVPEPSVFRVTGDMRLVVEPLEIGREGAHGCPRRVDP